MHQPFDHLQFGDVRTPWSQQLTTPDHCLTHGTGTIRRGGGFEFHQGRIRTYLIKVLIEVLGFQSIGERDVAGDHDL